MCATFTRAGSYLPLDTLAGGSISYDQNRNLFSFEMFPFLLDLTFLQVSPAFLQGFHLNSRAKTSPSYSLCCERRGMEEYNRTHSAKMVTYRVS